MTRKSFSHLMKAWAILFALAISLTVVWSEKAGSDMSIPSPKDIFQLILPADEVQEKSFDDILDNSSVQKWATPVLIYLAIPRDQDEQAILNLTKIQLIPLMESISQATGLHFKRVYSVEEANFIMAFSEQSSDVFQSLNLNQIRQWFGATDDKFASVEKVFDQAQSQCFRFIDAPGQQIARAISFTSTALSEADQEKCLARGLLFSLGLRGAINSSSSAKSPGTSSRSIGILDEMALNLIYHPEVKPGMTLREALAAHSKSK